MFNWLRRRRLSSEARKKLMIVAARAEEAVIETHVNNVLDMLEMLGDEIEVDRALEVYAEMMSLDEPVAATVANRLLARLESPQPAGRFRNVFRDNARTR